jgi:hypothetical protein
MLGPQQVPFLCFLPPGVSPAMSFSPLLICYTLGCNLGGGPWQDSLDIITSYHECHHIGCHVGHFLSACLICPVHVEGVLVLVAAVHLFIYSPEIW